MQVDPFSTSRYIIPNQNLAKFGIIEHAEVLDIILDDKHPQYGGPKDIGKIFIRRAHTENSTSTVAVAYPLIPNQQFYPVRFEIVLIVNGPSINDGHSLYYLSPFNIWGMINHNAMPYLDGLYGKDYENDGGEGGEGINIADKIKVNGNDIELEFGDSFEENLNVPLLQPYEGDYILNGRWGNSIRFGSTVLNKNNWSSKGNNGNPIIIISNNAPKTKKKGGQPIGIENVNEDDSTIYLCSNQLIGLTPSTMNYSAYRNIPEKVQSFTGNQILFNSDRIVINSKRSDTLISSKKSIGLSASTINISADKEFIVNAERNYLGVNANEPIPLGRQLMMWLKELTTALSVLTVVTPSGPSTPPVNVNSFITLASKLETILSQKSFTE